MIGTGTGARRGRCKSRAATLRDAARGVNRGSAKHMRLITVTWSKSASAFYLPLLSRQRQAIDALVRSLRESEGSPGREFRQIDEYPDYWFAKTPTDVLMVVQRRAADYAVTGFADWQAQVNQALEEAAAAVAEADTIAQAA